MKTKRYLWIDQFGNKYFACTVAELREQIACGGSRVSPMYVDKTDGTTVQTGYVIGQHWLARYEESPWEPRR